MIMIKRDKASFRDPSGYVFWHQGQVYRTIMPSFGAAFEAVRANPIFATWLDKGWLWPETCVPCIAPLPEEAFAILSHPTLPLVSYPYEWSFSLLKAAALFHLDLQIDALQQDIMLNDASAFNIQFDGVKPIFIDHLAFRPYETGEYWQAHKQFFEQFINPLILQAYCGVNFQAWYRGGLSGIKTTDLVALLPFFKKCSPNVFLHLVLQARFEKMQKKAVAKATKQVAMPKQGLLQLWKSLRNWINTLEEKTSTSPWQQYTKTHSYEQTAWLNKQAFIKAAIAEVQPDLVWDLGCNTGVFSELALQAGAKRVVGFDSDAGALQQAYQLAQQKNLAFTPLYMDMTNPTPAQGFSEEERLGFAARPRPDFILALALIHHLAIVGNIPLSMIIDYLLMLAPQGIIEFIPKQDPMVQQLLLQRKDIFTDYTRENFIHLLQAKAIITQQQSLSENGRELFWYKRC